MTRSYLLDTSVVSMNGPGRNDPSPAFADWVLSNYARLHLSTITAFEIEQGAEKLIRAGAHARGGNIARWLDGLLVVYRDRVLPVDIAVARRAGTLSDAAFARGKHPGLADVLIAATADIHDLVLLTRNMRHFQPLGIAIADPLAALPD